MKTNKVLWLLIAALFIPAIAPSEGSVDPELDLKIICEFSSIALPENETAPFHNVTRMMLLSDTLVGFDQFDNLTAADLADMELKEGETSLILKVYIDYYQTCYQFVEWFGMADEGEAYYDVDPGHFGGEMANGLWWLNCTTLQGLIDTSYFAGYNASIAREAYLWALYDWYYEFYTLYSMIVFKDYGVMTLSMGETFITYGASTYTFMITEGFTEFTLSSFICDMQEFNADGNLYEKWYEKHTYMPVNVAAFTGKGDGTSISDAFAPFNVVSVLLAFLGVTIVVMKRK